MITNTFTDDPRPVGSIYDLIDQIAEPVTVQRFRVTDVKPASICDIEGWSQESVPITEPRPITRLEQFWWYWSPWKPWCWWRKFRAAFLYPLGWPRWVMR